MSTSKAADLDHQLSRLEERLPDTAARVVAWVREPSSGWLRIPLGLVLIAGGIVGFLPILGFWMVPLGLALIAKDVPFLRPPIAKLVAWINRTLDQRARGKKRSA
jgi:hypothetical protein